MQRDVLTRQEAEARAAQIDAVSYRIELDLRAGAKEYRGKATVRFEHSGGDTFLEFVGGTIDDFEINGAAVEPQWDGYRIALPARLLREQNEVSVSYVNAFDRAGEGFHQFFDPEDGAEYIYSMLEPYGAHRLYPCFDQPDLKATFELIVTAPDDWSVISSGRLSEAEPADDGRVRRSYERTVPFSTYLFSVIAGPFHLTLDEHNGLPLGLYCRASMAEYLDAEELFSISKDGLDFFSRLFGRPYPFTKYDQVFAPEFNWGGMENVAAVVYTDALVFRDPPTRDQRVRRAEVLLHELAHMWFGDLVTMKWWDDLWLNESFATFVAYLAMADSGRWHEVWQDFNARNKLGAYRDDQRPTTHPVAAQVANTHEVFLNFDQITYGKGASVLRQLMTTIGEEAFAAGLRTYFRRYEFANSTLADFLAALQDGSGRDLAGWAARWLTTASVNTLSVEWAPTADRLSGIVLHQRAPDDFPTLRPHAVEVGVVSETPVGLHVDALPASIEGPTVPVPEAAGLASPVMVFPNHRDLTYAKVDLDSVSLQFVHRSLHAVDDDLLRHQLWQSLWEMVRDRTLPSLDYLKAVERHLPVERSDQIVKMVLATAAGTLARYIPEAMKDRNIRSFVSMCRRAIDDAPPGDLRVLWARALIGAASHPDDLEMAGRIVDGKEAGEGLAVDQDMRWELAVRWSAHGVEGEAARVASEAERDPSDRGKRALVRAEVSRPDPAAKAEAWEKLHASGYESLATARAAMAGFQWWKQRPLLDRYVQEFFARIEDIINDWEWEAAKAYFYGLHPRYRVDAELLGATAALTDAADPRLQRLAIEAVDDLERALACRALAEASLPDATARPVPPHPGNGPRPS